MSEMVERVAEAIRIRACERGYPVSPMVVHHLAAAAIEAMRELPSDPGPRYEKGDYSRRTQSAMVDDALAVTNGERK